MSLDLNTILKDWPHETGTIKVRKIVGLDGTREIAIADRSRRLADGIDRPPGWASARTAANRFSSIINCGPRMPKRKGETYELTPEQCAELQQEGIQYYHRYLSLFQINDFAGVVRDTQRNLDLFDFVAEHTDREESRLELQQFRPYVLMMNTRARASILLDRENFPKRFARSSAAAMRSRRSSSARISPSWPRRAPRSLFSTNGWRKSGPSVRYRSSK